MVVILLIALLYLALVVPDDLCSRGRRSDSSNEIDMAAAAAPSYGSGGNHADAQSSGRHLRRAVSLLDQEPDIGG